LTGCYWTVTITISDIGHRKCRIAVESVEAFNRARDFFMDLLRDFIDFFLHIDDHLVDVIRAYG
jgi:hypothetical protein